MCNTKAAANINCGLWAVTMCQCRLIVCNTAAQRLWGGGSTLLVREALHLCRQGVYGKSLCFLLDLAVNPKLQPKINLIMFKRKKKETAFSLRKGKPGYQAGKRKKSHQPSLWLLSMVLKFIQFQTAFSNRCLS